MFGLSLRIDYWQTARSVIDAAIMGLDAAINWLDQERPCEEVEFAGRVECLSPSYAVSPLDMIGLRGLKLAKVTLSGGRSGQLVKNLIGPPSSVVKGGPGRVFITNEQGQVVLDITRARVKQVLPGRGFGPKRAPTSAELELLESVGGGL